MVVKSSNSYNIFGSTLQDMINILVHVIWTERQMLKLVLNVKYLLLLSFLTVTEFYNLGHIQGIISVH